MKPASEATLTIVTGYPPKMMELEANPNGSLVTELRRIERRCTNWSPGLCLKRKGPGTWLINRHHRAEVESILRCLYDYVNIQFR